MTRTRTLSFITNKLFDLTYTCKLGPSEGTGTDISCWVFSEKSARTKRCSYSQVNCYSFPDLQEVICRSDLIFLIYHCTIHAWDESTGSYLAHRITYLYQKSLDLRDMIPDLKITPHFENPSFYNSNLGATQSLKVKVEAERARELFKLVFPNGTVTPFSVFRQRCRPVSLQRLVH